MTTVAISSITDPVDSSNVSAATFTGTTDLDTNTVAVKVLDSAGTSVTGSATVTPVTGAWSATLNLSTLLDGLLTWEATATAVATTQAFAAKSGEKRASTDYITETEFRAYVNDSSSLESGRIAAAITAASRAVDAYCDRWFYQVTETNYLWPYQTKDPFYVCLEGDLATTTGLSVTLDTSGNNTFSTTWTVDTQFVLEPVNQAWGGLRNVPFTNMRAVNGNYWPALLSGIFTQPVRPPIKVTGSWGWPTVPEPVTQATKVLAAMFYKLGDAPLGATYGDYGVLRVKENPMAEALLRPYARSGAIAVA